MACKSGPSEVYANVTGFSMTELGANECSCSTSACSSGCGGYSGSDGAPLDRPIIPTSIASSAAVDGNPFGMRARDAIGDPRTLTPWMSSNGSDEEFETSAVKIVDTDCHMELDVETGDWKLTCGGRIGFPWSLGCWTVSTEEVLAMLEKACDDSAAMTEQTENSLRKTANRFLKTSLSEVSCDGYISGFSREGCTVHGTCNVNCSETGTVA